MARAFARFRWWLLLIFVVGWAAVYSLYIAYGSQLPPTREALGDAGYASPWRTIVLGGAIQGAFVYFLLLAMPRIVARLRPPAPTDSAA